MLTTKATYIGLLNIFIYEINFYIYMGFKSLNKLT